MSHLMIQFVKDTEKTVKKKIKTLSINADSAKSSFESKK